MQDFEYLSFGDALFLLLERREAPLNIASVSVFNGVMDYKKLVRYIESRLPLMPRFRQRVVPAPFNVGLPHWEADHDFDIRHHVHEIRLRRGTELELKHLAGRLLSCVMDRAHPLWDITLVHGLKDHRTAVIIRAHHAMADGISGIALLDSLMDSSPTPRRIRRAKPAQGGATPLDPLVTAAGDLINWWTTSVGRVLSVETEILQLAQRMISGFSNPSNGDSESGDPAPGNSEAESFRAMLPEIASPSVRLPFNKVCRGPQSFTWAQISFDRIRCVKKKTSVTVNDVILTVVAAAYRDYSALLGADVVKHTLRVVIPVNTREASAAAELGNQITFAPIDVPFRIRSISKLLHAVNTRTRRMKTTGLAQIVAMAGRLLGVIPPPIQAALAPLISQLPISLCNVICTNIPGPKEPRYMMGHEMVQCYPYVPIGGEMALNCAVLTYNGNAYFGFSGDHAIAGELERIATAVSENFDKLERNLGLAPRSQRTRSKPRTKSSRKPQATVSPAQPEMIETAVDGTETPPSAPEKVLAVAAG